MNDDGQPAEVTGSDRPPKQRVPSTARSSSKPIVIAAVAFFVVVAGALALITGADDGTVELPDREADVSGTTELPDGVEVIDVSNRSHVEGDVVYDTNPGVGGDHADVWVNCGYYAVEQSEEQAVHSLEHGAVWISYRPDLDEEQIAQLQDLAAQPFTLVSPVDDLDAPIVASAWGVRLESDRAGDPRLADFLAYFRQGPQTPELGAPCTRGVGTPS